MSSACSYAVAARNDEKIGILPNDTEPSIGRQGARSDKGTDYRAVACGRGEQPSRRHSHNRAGLEGKTVKQSRNIGTAPFGRLSAVDCRNEQDRGAKIQYRPLIHPVWVRVTHWINALHADDDPLGLTDLQCLAAVRLHISDPDRARQLPRRRAVAALRGYVAARDQRRRLRRTRHLDRAFPPQAFSDQPSRGVARFPCRAARPPRPRRSHGLQRPFANAVISITLTVARPWHASRRRAEGSLHYISQSPRPRLCSC